MTNNENSNKKRLLTIDEACEELRVSDWLVRRMIQMNKITTVKIGSRRLIASEDLDKFINERKEDEYAPSQG